MSSSSPDEVTVHVMNVGPIDPARQAQLELLLNEDERARAGRLKVASHRWTYAAAHALLQRCLEAKTGRRTSSFTLGPHGRPELADAFGHPPLRFSLSHTEGLIAVAIGFGHDIGVDTEHIEWATPIHELAKRFFAADEAAFIAGAGEALARSRFFAIWTAKEAVAKATGLGLRLPLDSFSVTLDPLAVAFHPAAARCAGKWGLDCLATPGHRLSLAVRSEDDLTLPTSCFRQVSLAAL